MQVVVLERDLPKHGLQRGDVGTIVETYEPDGLEIEFVTASGDTEALVTVTTSDVRPADRDERVGRLRRDVRAGLEAADAGNYEDYGARSVTQLGADVTARGRERLANRSRRTRSEPVIPLQRNVGADRRVGRDGLQERG